MENVSWLGWSHACQRLRSGRVKILPMQIQQRNIRHTYRRCPYAMRARMAFCKRGAYQVQELTSLRDKPAEMLALVLANGEFNTIWTEPNTCSVTAAP